MGYGINLGGYVGTTYVVIMSSTTGGIFSNCRQVDTEPLGRKKGHASIADCVPRRVALRIVKLRIARASNKIKAIYYVEFILRLLFFLFFLFRLMVRDCYHLRDTSIMCSFSHEITLFKMETRNKKIYNIELKCRVKRSIKFVF